MARIPDAFIDDLLARTDIVEVVGTRVPLKRQGKEYAARCPFHDERSASFTVSPTKQFYHCFGCGAHGTAISFLMNYDRLEFLDAVDDLAKRVGMEVPRDANVRNEDSDTRELYAVVQDAANFFCEQRAASEQVRAYIRGRNIDEAIVERYAVGYAPGGYSTLKDALGTDARRMALLERAGLFSRNDKGHVYDKFRDRLMFPIHDRRGRVIAFGGRVLSADDSPKYLNSPETVLFHKGRELYGLWQARQANPKLDRLVVVEGYMDVVALAQYGVTQAVATLGTSTTSDHAELLFRNAPDVFFCFDGDRAGRAAAWKALESVLPRMKDGRQAFFLFLPEGEDPDTIVRKEGAEGFAARLAQATPLSRFLFEQLSFDVDLSTADGKARLAEKSKKLVELIPDGAFRDRMEELHSEMTVVKSEVSSKALAWARDFAEQLNQDALSMERGHAPAGYLQKVSTSNVSRRGVAPAKASIPRRSLIRSAIAQLVHQPSLALLLQPPYRLAILRQPGIDLLVEILALVHDRPEISMGALLEHFGKREEADALRKLAMQSLHGDETLWREEFLDTMAQLDKQTLLQRVDELQAKQRDMPLDEQDKAELRALLTNRFSS